MTDLYSVGELIIDMIPGQEKDSYLKRAGGAPANVAIAVRRNGLTSKMACKLGNDDFGHFLADTLEENGVGRAVEEFCDEAITTIAFVTLHEGGERTFTFARKPGADMFLRPEEIKEEDILDSVMVHSGSAPLSASPEVEAATKAMKIAHENKKIVSFDLNYRNLQWDDDEKKCAEAVFKILPYVDLLKISDEEADMIGGEAEIPSLIKKYKLKAVVETLGKNGAKAYLDNGEEVFAESVKADAVDATGAGDAFWGGFLSKLRIDNVESVEDITKDKVEAALRYGNVSGSICVQSKGAISSLPTREQIEKILGEV